MPSTLASLTASEAAALIAAGEIRSAELVAACIASIEARENEVRAWAHFDPEHAMAQAREADLMRESGKAGGPLHGVPVGVKDIFDTADMPTENGTPLCAGRRPGRDAAAVRFLREAGAIIMGKTVTAELAVLHPGKTRNPHNPAHTPGGSSSGSAAAVAAGMVPIALGTQTNGSMIRPASFCGVYGFKPSFGLISRAGVLEESPPLDTIGVFSRSIEDLALTADVLAPYDAEDSSMWARSRAPLRPIAMSEPPLSPQIAFIRTPVWDQADEVTKEAFAELVEALGDHCAEVVLPEAFGGAARWQRAIMFADIAKNYAQFYERGRERMSAVLQSVIEEGRRVTAVEYNAARDGQEHLYGMYEGVFDRFDAVITPAAPGPAPAALENTGNPAFSTLWTFLGVPAISMPLLQAENMPLGVQLVGPRRDDARLLRTARWVARYLESAE